MYLLWSCTHVNQWKNVSFVKLHRVGSGTMHNVLVQFAINHCAFVAIANCKYFQVFPQQVSKNMLFPPPQHPNFTGYNMFIDHAVFNRTRSDKFLPSDVVYITQIRHPYTHSFSVFDHYSKKLYPIRAVAPNYEQLLRNVMISNYERTLKLSNSCPHNKKFSVSRNFMALELGYEKQTHPNETEFLKHLHNINSQLHHVSILERLPESLVLLRRKLCWHTKDLLHIRMHQTNSGSQAKNLSDNLATFHKQWDSLDYVLYDFFLKRHEREVAAQDETFEDEVKQLMEDQNSFAAFCATICNLTSVLNENYTERIRTVLATNFTFPSTQFYTAFNVSYQDCVFLQLEEKDAKKSLFFNMNPSICKKESIFQTEMWLLKKRLALDCDTNTHVIPGLTAGAIQFVLKGEQCRKRYGA